MITTFEVVSYYESLKGRTLKHSFEMLSEWNLAESASRLPMVGCLAAVCLALLRVISSITYHIAMIVTNSATLSYLADKVVF
jgi:hypothetical protein